jgi:hypothetical protein
MYKENVVYIHIRKCYSVKKKRINPVICNNMVANYAEGNSQTQRQMTQDLTYRWNL